MICTASGPCIPSVKVCSMSAVRDGPEIKHICRGGLNRAAAEEGKDDSPPEELGLDDSPRCNWNASADSMGFAGLALIADSANNLCHAFSKAATICARQTTAICIGGSSEIVSGLSAPLAVISEPVSATAHKTPVMPTSSSSFAARNSASMPALFQFKLASVGAQTIRGGMPLTSRYSRASRGISAVVFAAAVVEKDDSAFSINRAASESKFVGDSFGNSHSEEGGGGGWRNLRRRVAGEFRRRCARGRSEDIFSCD